MLLNEAFSYNDDNDDVSLLMIFSFDPFLNHEMNLTLELGSM